MLNRLLVVATAAFLALMLLVGCSNTSESTTPERSTYPAAAPTYDFSNPQAAVRSYLDSITYAYHTADSEMATPAMTAWEWVRVDAYIEKNRQEGKGIEQKLTDLQFKAQSGEEPTVTVSTTESWSYRYFALADGKYMSEELTAAYVNDYTVVLEKGAWKVDKVEARAQSEVK